MVRTELMTIKGDARRSMLLKAALDSFSTRGYEGTTMRAVAETAGVTEPALFKYFRNKQELYEAVVTEFGPQEVFREPSLQNEAPVEDLLTSAVTAYMDGVWEHRGVVRMMIMGQLSSRESREPPVDEGRKYVETVLRQRAGRGEVRPDIAEGAADVISAAVSGLLLRAILHEPADWSVVRDEFVNHLLDVLKSGIKQCPEEDAAGALCVGTVENKRVA